MFRTLIIMGLIFGAYWLYTNGYSLNTDKAMSMVKTTLVEAQDGLFVKTTDSRTLNITVNK